MAASGSADYDVPELELVPMASRSPEIELPDGFQVKIALETPIGTSTAVGDEVQAKLLRAIKHTATIPFSRKARFLAAT